MLLSKKDLRCPIPQSHNLVCISAHRKTNGSGKTKVSQFKDTLLVDKQILRLQVSMEDSSGVTIRKSGNKLVKITLREVNGELIDGVTMMYTLT